MYISEHLVTPKAADDLMDDIETSTCDSRNVLIRAALLRMIFLEDVTTAS